MKLLLRANLIAPCLFLLIVSPVFANGGAVELPNPIKCENFLCLLLGAVRFLLGGLAVFGTFMFMYGGFLWLTSYGNEARIKQGKDTLAWATIGLIITLVSWQVIKYILTVVTQAQG